MHTIIGSPIIELGKVCLKIVTPPHLPICPNPFAVPCPPGIELEVNYEVGILICSAAGNVLRWSVNGTTITIAGDAPVGTKRANPNLPAVIFAFLLTIDRDFPGSSFNFQGNRTSVLSYSPSSLDPGILIVTCGGRLSLVNACSINVSVGKSKHWLPWTSPTVYILGQSLPCIIG